MCIFISKILCYFCSEIGAEQAWLKIQEIDESACMHRLLALEGAIQGVKKTLLPEERKRELKEFYNWHKK